MVECTHGVYTRWSKHTVECIYGGAYTRRDIHTEGIYTWKNNHTERRTHGGNIHMEGYTQRDIRTEGHIRWYIHMMGPTYGGAIHTEGHIH